MKGPIIIDTGPLVAFINRREPANAWACEQFDLITPPFITCESVISECCFLLQRANGGVDNLMQLLERGVVAIRFNLADELAAISRLLKRYASVPISLADACLVRMAELYFESPILTLD